LQAQPLLVACSFGRGVHEGLCVVMLNDHEALARGAGGEGASERGFRGSDLVKGSKEAGYGGRRSGHLAGGRRGFDQRGQVGDPYWAPCNNYDSYGADSCE
jgi:hypothetical protein